MLSALGSDTAFPGTLGSSNAHQGTPIILVSVLAVTLIIFWISTVASTPSSTPPGGYILHGSVTHARSLPVESKHAFTYPALYAFVSLRGLESGALNYGYGFWGWAFGYGRAQQRLMAINPGGYLRSGKEGERGLILERLEELLRSVSPRTPLSDASPEPAFAVHDAWVLTMPSCMGWEGINPLTMYFVDGVGSESERTQLSHVVLEVHNTFGEGHVYVLRLGEGEDMAESRTEGYDHQWTFPRQFHVSPFNDRSGYYTVAIKRPTHPPSRSNEPRVTEEVRRPRPTVRVQLYTDRPTTATADTRETFREGPLRGELKLTAILRSTTAYPLSSNAVIWSLVKMPFDLFLTMPRILYQAWYLHYGKPRLNVFMRPEMKWTSLWRRSIPVEPPGGRTEDGGLVGGMGATSTKETDSAGGGGGVMWLGEGLVERYARKKVEEFLDRRVDEVGIQVTLIPANLGLESRCWVPTVLETKADGDGSTGGKASSHLRIWYLSSKLFSTLLLAPSAEHALLLGCDTECWFQVSSPLLFNKVFCNGANATSKEYSALQRLRLTPIARAVPLSRDESDSVLFPAPVPSSHFLDCPSTPNVSNYVMISLQLFLDRLEERVFRWTKARAVQGQEPWLMWGRAARVHQGGREVVDGTGSVGWVGSVRSPCQEE